MAIATPEDIAASLLRDLTPSEKKYSGVLLDRVEVMIQARLNLNLDEITSHMRAALIQVEAEAVARVFRNPEGRIQEADGQYSYQLSNLVASGMMQILPSEWELLGAGSNLWKTIPPALDGYLTATGKARTGNEFGFNIRPDRTYIP